MSLVVGDVAKLVDAADLGSAAERYKSSGLFFPTSLFLAQFGRASVLGAEGQRFKSFRIDHYEGGEIGIHKRLKISRRKLYGFDPRPSYQNLG